MLEDMNGTYSLENVVAITKGGVPNPNLKIHKQPTAILQYVTGATIQTLVPYEEALKQWTGGK